MKIYRVASSLGPKFSVPQNYLCHIDGALQHMAMIGKHLDGLPGSDTMRIEFQENGSGDWHPLPLVCDHCEQEVYFGRRGLLYHRSNGYTFCDDNPLGYLRGPQAELRREK